MTAGDACGSMMLGDNSPRVASKPRTKTLLLKRLLFACLFSMLVRQVYDNLGWVIV